MGIIGQRGRLERTRMRRGGCETFGDDAPQLVVRAPQTIRQPRPAFVMRIGGVKLGPSKARCSTATARQVEERMPLHRQQCPCLKVIIFVLSFTGGI